jgi:hypothetical protein
MRFLYEKHILLVLNPLMMSILKKLPTKSTVLTIITIVGKVNDGVSRKTQYNFQF